MTKHLRHPARRYRTSALLLCALQCTNSWAHSAATIHLHDHDRYLLIFASTLALAVLLRLVLRTKTSHRTATLRRAVQED